MGEKNPENVPPELVIQFNYMQPDYQFLGMHIPSQFRCRQEPPLWDFVSVLLYFLTQCPSDSTRLITVC